jgi:hypothetical protein
MRTIVLIIVACRGNTARDVAPAPTPQVSRPAPVAAPPSDAPARGSLVEIEKDRILGQPIDVTYSCQRRVSDTRAEQVAEVLTTNGVYAGTIWGTAPDDVFISSIGSLLHYDGTGGAFTSVYSNGKTAGWCEGVKGDVWISARRGCRSSPQASARPSTTRSRSTPAVGWRDP